MNTQWTLDDIIDRVREDNLDSEEIYDIFLNANVNDLNKLARIGIIPQLYFKYFDIENNLKRDLLYARCYSLGHSSGYVEIFNYMQDLVDLIK